MVMASSATSNLFKTISMADACLTSDWVQEDNALITDGAEGSEEEGVFEESEEELNVEPSEEVKVFAGNLAFGVDNQKLAELFERLELSMLLT
ncbi:28 kDa ribonucleoprotein [Pyrus ussuriensis x Pyrus communis]|uniref:28 kDa ribonucleoprotein n=1 Tax=Pyrus ussuriensis x Pyrus communis TaxID=2448454 RepID=A0A5N5G2A1_9ROSA|nr:28 kDa ribonucleoprotein [Pyrus ussuriensis x Pyrus communis]